MQDHFTHFTPMHNLIKHHFGLRGLTVGINTVSGQVLEQVIDTVNQLTLYLKYSTNRSSAHIVKYVLNVSSCHKGHNLII